jgi:hypothetical protein
MFDKVYFDQLEARLRRYFQRFPANERVAVILSTQNADYLMVEIVEYDERFITLVNWPREDADLPDTWDKVRNSLSAITVPYAEIRSVEFNPRIVRGHEIGFRNRDRDTPPNKTA